MEGHTTPNMQVTCLATSVLHQAHKQNRAFHDISYSSQLDRSAKQSFVWQQAQGLECSLQLCWTLLFCHASWQSAPRLDRQYDNISLFLSLSKTTNFPAWPSAICNSLSQYFSKSHAASRMALHRQLWSAGKTLSSSISSLWLKPNDSKKQHRGTDRLQLSTPRESSTAKIKPRHSKKCLSTTNFSSHTR